MQSPSPQELMPKPLNGPVARHLAEILRSPEFVRSTRLSRLLRFVVEAQQSGLELNERLLAEQVFDKDGEWDPKIDPVVRITFSRLRERLKRYQETAGVGSVRIELPPGSYAPLITVHDEVLPVAPPAAPARPPWRWAAPALLLGLAAWGFNRQTPPETQEFHVLNFASQLGAEVNPAFSPDGKWIAYSHEVASGRFDLYLRGASGGEARRITNGPAKNVYPSWSPDSRQLAFLRIAPESELRLLQLDTGQDRKLVAFQAEIGAWSAEPTGALGNPGPSWTPDGKWLLYSRRNTDPPGSSIMRVSLTGSDPVELHSEPGLSRFFFPRMSVNGDLAYVRYTTHGAGDVFVKAKNQPQPKQLSADRRTVRGLEWSRDGKLLYFGSNRMGSNQIWMVNADGGGLELLPTNSSSASEPSLSPDGTQMAFSEQRENWNIWRSRLVGGQFQNPERLIASSGRNYDPRYSPNGKQIAFLSDRSGNWQLWLADAEGRNPRQLTDQKSPWLGAFSWSPDGTRLICERRPEHHASLFFLDARSGAISPFDDSPYEDRLPAFSHDGKSIYFTSNRDGGHNIYRKDLATGRIQKITEGGGHLARESASGKWLVYTDNNNHLRRLPVGTIGRGALVDAVLQPNILWSLAGEDLFLALGDRDLGRLGPAGLRSRLNLPNPLVQYVASLDAASDGNSLLFATRDYDETDVKLRVSGPLRSTKP